MKIFSDEDFLHPDSSGLSFFLAPSSLQRAPSMWNSIKSGFGNIFGNFGWVNSRECTTSTTHRPRKKEKRKSPAPMCQAALDEWKQRQCENLRSPAHLPSAVLEDGVCCSMCFRWLRYPVSALRNTAAATHLSAFQEHCRVITRQPFRNGGRSTSHLQRNVRQHGTRYGGPCITNHWVSYKYITKCPPRASIVHPAWR